MGASARFADRTPSGAASPRRALALGLRCLCSVCCSSPLFTLKLTGPTPSDFQGLALIITRRTRPLSVTARLCARVATPSGPPVTRHTECFGHRTLGSTSGLPTTFRTTALVAALTHRCRRRLCTSLRAAHTHRRAHKAGIPTDRPDAREDIAPRGRRRPVRLGCDRARELKSRVFSSAPTGFRGGRWPGGH